MEVNPWDLPVKHHSNLSHRKNVSTQESYVKRLKRNLSATESHSDLSPLKLSSKRLSLVAKQFNIVPSDAVTNDDKENNLTVDFVQYSAEKLSCTKNGKTSDRLHYSVALSNDSFSQIRNVARSDQAITSIIAQPSISTVPKHILQKRGSFLGKSVLSVNNVAESNISSTSDVANPLETQFLVERLSHELPSELAGLSSGSERDSSTTFRPTDLSTFRPNVQPESTSVPYIQSCHLVSRPQKTSRTPVVPTQNYLKLNLKKKCFSRKGAIRQRRLQRKVRFEKFKRRFMTTKARQYGTGCFRCGESGHWANKCPLAIMESKPKIETHTNDAHASKLSSASWRIYEPQELDKRYFTAQFDDMSNAAITSNTADSLKDYSVDTLEEMISETLKTFGFQGFRVGQKLIILRILSGVSTLAVLPTAAGKSLCYQLPAALYQKLCGTTALVVSPLISLMQDQILKKFNAVEGAFLNSSQSLAVKEEILQNARNGQYAFLMVSPEALVESDWLLQPGRLPSLSFVCIDEAHCLADWSHHFRPSYLRVCKLLRDCLHVNCLLGLSATCTPSTIVNVCCNLGIHDPIRLTGETIDQQTLTQPAYVQPILTPIPDNLCITASMDSSRDEALLSLLTRPPFSQLTGGILIYCATRDQTERLASFIRTALQEVVDQVGRRRLNWTTAAYHAGQSAIERARVQKRFMAGRVRVLVATSAFGMGLNKPDLQAVIHYSLTKSFENYVQEIGRVGRCQQESYCHAFLPPALITDPREANELRRYVFANHIDLVMLKRLLQMLFSGLKCSCRTAGQCSGHLHAIDAVAIGEALDIKTESLATLLAYMELDPAGPLISMLQPGYASVTVDCYGGPAELAYASQRCLAVAAGLGLERERRDEHAVSSSRQLTINLVELCNRWGWRPSTVRQELRGLEWDSNRDTKAGSSAGTQCAPYRTGIHISLSNWSWWFWVHGPELPLSSERLDRCLQYLHNRLHAVETAGLDSLDRLTQALASVAETEVSKVYPTVLPKEKELDDCANRRKERSDSAHALVKAHFVKATEELNGTGEDAVEFHWPPPVSDNQVSTSRTHLQLSSRCY
ncbi:ATP-dependent DNA helicase Q4 [Paragonimus heterotremus]|uniref:DNA 3'-5' helicase n=1 Tax=Paragonimus heterotremus TaxID=100268 RepID=A0A8J4T4R5_9TREM|nr:ATP-dependent DNA helicase Q4 [Paragonimus heterotremus]